MRADDGRVYDLSSKLPFAAYDIAADVDIFWLDIHEGVLSVSDRDGQLTVIDHEDEYHWARRSRGEHAWLVRADERAVYHGHHRGVTAYAPDGSGEPWHTPTRGGVLFGWQEDDAVYAGSAHRVTQRLEPGARYVVDAPHAAATGFYRVRGEIRRLLRPAPPPGAHAAGRRVGRPPYGPPDPRGAGVPRGRRIRCTRARARDGGAVNVEGSHP